MASFKESEQVVKMLNGEYKWQNCSENTQREASFVKLDAAVDELKGLGGTSFCSEDRPLDRPLLRRLGILLSA